MATITTPTPEQSTAPSALGTPPATLTPEQVKLLARAECYFRLEGHVDSQLAAVKKRRTDEEEKLITALCAAAEPVANTLFAQLKAFEAATLTITNDENQVERFRAFLQARIDAFLREHDAVAKLALDAQLKKLEVKQSSEQKEVELVNKQIDDVRKRLEMLSKPEPQAAQARTAKARTARSKPAVTKPIASKTAPPQRKSK